MASNPCLATLEHSLSDENLAKMADDGPPGISEHGTHYTWLTTATEYGPQEVARVLTVVRGDACDPAPSVVERLKAALFILAHLKPHHPPELLSLRRQPAVMQRCQGMLNEAVLSHPQLMNPKFLVHVIDCRGDHGSVPVAHAIAMGNYSRFPMEGDAGVTRERLKEWLSSWHVRSGLTSTAHDVDDVLEVARDRMPLAASFNQPASRSWVVASLEGLWNDPVSGNPFTGRPASGSEWPRDGTQGCVERIYERAFASALGTTAFAVTGPATHVSCAPLLEFARAGNWLQEFGFRLGCATETYEVVFNTEFIAPNDYAPGHWHVVQPSERAVMFNAAIEALLSSGVCSDGPDVAELLTNSWPMDGCDPQPTLETVLPCVRLLVDTGGAECLDELLGNAPSSDSDASVDDNVWSVAATMVVTEARMSHVIDQASGAVAGAVPQASAHVRRRRVV